jgi:uncharacterized protein DUF4129
MMLVPVQPDRDQAREWAVQELSRREYQEARPDPLERALRWVWDAINGISTDVGAPPLLGLLVVTIVIALVVTYAVRRAGGLHGTARRRTAPVLPTRHTTAADHRAAAERHADAEEWDQAVVEQFRAVARELEERALLSPQPGRTALEVAREAGKSRPDLAADLLKAARSFDDVSYGHLTVGRPAYTALLDLDGRLRTTAGTVTR